MVLVRRERGESSLAQITRPTLPHIDPAGIAPISLADGPPQALLLSVVSPDSDAVAAVSCGLAGEISSEILATLEPPEAERHKAEA